jgi:hypothetical protein
MLIVRKQRKKEVGGQDRGKARKRAAFLRLVFFSALIAGLLGFFVYNNMDYLPSVGEIAGKPGKTKSAEARQEMPPKERKSAAELLGMPEFFEIKDAVPLNNLIEERPPEPAPDTVPRLQQALLSQVRPDSVKKADTATYPLAAMTPPKADEPPPVREADRPDTAPPPPPTRELSTAKPDTADVRQISLTPVADRGAAAAKARRESAGSMVISNIRCRLADRDDISINVSVELFYEGKALHEEVHSKRGTLAAVLGSVVRRQEFGKVVMASLRAELLDAFNDILTSGQLVDVDIQGFNIVR